MDARHLFLVGGEGFHHCPGPRAQGLGPLDCLAGVRQHGRLFPFGFRRRPVDVGLVPFAARLSPHHRGLLAVETLPAQGQQGTRPLDGLQRALLQGFHRLAQRPPALIELVLAFIDLPLALGQLGLTPVRRPLPLVRLALPLVCEGVTLASSAFALVSFAFALPGQSVTLVGHEFALVRRALALSMGLTLSMNLTLSMGLTLSMSLTLSRRFILRLDSRLLAFHAPRMHRSGPALLAAG